MGLRDQYVETKDPEGNRISIVNKGYENNIMGRIGGAPSEADIERIIGKNSTMSVDTRDTRTFNAPPSAYAPSSGADGSTWK